ncbi:hypothetical protein J3369_18235 [Alteromonas sp. NFXS44]|uniref:hypothetical protein n=1 Tax=Alteromonas sp. NFXS44 TaxID=2818435 RepID=UPI0032DF5AC6
MEHLSFEPTSIQRNQLIALTKGNDLNEANLKDLYQFENVLRKHLQETKPGTFIREDLRVAIENTQAVIQMKQAEKSWYEKPIGLIGIGLFVTVLGGLYVLYLTN